MRGTLIAVIFCFAAAFAGTATATPEDEAAAAYRRGDYLVAFRIWHALAEKGDGEAQMAIAFMYHDGEGVPKDLRLAYMWFYLAASLLPVGEQAFDDALAARDLTAKRMTPEQIAEARQMAEWCQTRKYKGCD